MNWRRVGDRDTGQEATASAQERGQRLIPEPGSRDGRKCIISCQKQNRLLLDWCDVRVKRGGKVGFWAARWAPRQRHPRPENTERRGSVVSTSDLVASCCHQFPPFYHPRPKSEVWIRGHETEPVSPGDRPFNLSLT